MGQAWDRGHLPVTSAPPLRRGGPPPPAAIRRGGTSPPHIVPSAGGPPSQVFLCPLRQGRQRHTRSAGPAVALPPTLDPPGRAPPATPAGIAETPSRRAQPPLPSGDRGAPSAGGQRPPRRAGWSARRSPNRAPRRGEARACQAPHGPGRVGLLRLHDLPRRPHDPFRYGPRPRGARRMRDTRPSRGIVGKPRGLPQEARAVAGDHRDRSLTVPPADAGRVPALCPGDPHLVAHR